MKNRALIGLSAACMSALVATAVGCGEPSVEPYTPPEKEPVETAAPATAGTETDAKDEAKEDAEPNADVKEAADEAAKDAEETIADDLTKEDADPAVDAEAEKVDSEEAKIDANEGDKADAQAEEKNAEDAKAAAGDEAEKTDGAKTDATAGTLTDGTYTAEGKGIGGAVPVTVEVKDGKIASVEVGENSETAGIGSKAIEQLPEAIVAANGVEGVDAVSGATITSKAIFTAVEDCLKQAEAPAADDKAADKADGKDAKAEGAGLTDGTYEAEGKGIGGKVPVTVEVKDGKIAAVTVGDNSETAGIGSKAIEQLPALIVEANGVEGVDGVSGATITSKAIFTAVEDALAQAQA